jgi:hypothetical protein
VWAASGGNPFYLGELLRAGEAGPAAGRGTGEQAGTSASDIVARRIEERIRRLDPDALGLAQALVVLGMAEISGTAPPWPGWTPKQLSG